MISVNPIHPKYGRSRLPTANHLIAACASAEPMGGNWIGAPYVAVCGFANRVGDWIRAPYVAVCGFANRVGSYRIWDVMISVNPIHPKYGRSRLPTANHLIAACASAEPMGGDWIGAPYVAVRGFANRVGDWIRAPYVAVCGFANRVGSYQSGMIYENGQSSPVLT